MLNYLCYLLIIMGMIMLIISLINYEKMKESLIGLLRVEGTIVGRLLIIYKYLIVFFLLGYSIILFFTTQQGVITQATVVISLLLFFGALFVLIAVLLQKVLMKNIINARVQQTDSLTGLLNKGAFQSKVSAMMAENKEAYMIVADMDGFKQINDSFGHMVGDEVIKYGAEVIRNIIHVEDILARFGGDEFVVYALNWHRDELHTALTEINKQLLQWAEKKYSIPNASFSFGIVLQENCCDYAELFSQADSAMYQAKANGKSCYFDGN